MVAMMPVVVRRKGEKGEERGRGRGGGSGENALKGGTVAVVVVGMVGRSSTCLDDSIQGEESP